MKVAIIGGSFNPIHRGHIEMGRIALKSLPIDKVIFIPTYQNPLKEKTTTTYEDRLNMVELALEENMEVIEDRSIYTIDVLRNLDYKEIYLVIGEDALKQFHLWKDYKEILEKVHLVVFSRGERVEVDFPFIRLEMSLDISSTQFRNTKDFNLLNEKVENYIKDRNLYL